MRRRERRRRRDPEMLLGYKIMRLERGRLISGANARLSYPAKIGAVLEVPGKGLYVSTNKEYVLDYYRGHDKEVLLTVAFDVKDIGWGRQTLHDREPELAVRVSRIINIERL